MLGVINAPLTTSDAIFIASWLVRDPTPKSHLGVGFPGPLVLTTVTNQVPRGKGSGVEISMQEVQGRVPLGVIPAKE